MRKGAWVKELGVEADQDLDALARSTCTFRRVHARVQSGRVLRTPHMTAPELRQAREQGEWQHVWASSGRATAAAAGYGSMRPTRMA